MNNKKDQQDTIERYVLNQLSEEERIAFEKQLAEDTQLYQEVELTRHVIHAFEMEGEAEAWEAMKSMPEKEFKKLLELQRKSEPDKKRTLMIRFSIAASTAAILIFIYVGIQPKYSSQILFNEYYTSYEIMPSRGERDIKNDSIFQISTEMIQSGQLNEAIKNFENLSHLKNFEYQEENRWYLALAYLKDNQREKAQQILYLLIKDNGEYSDISKDLIKKLEERKLF